jgi:hypothetical protein
MPTLSKLAGPLKPLLFDTVREASLWRIFNEYEVTYEDIAWFLKETKSMYTMRR